MDSFNKVISFVLGLVVVLVFFAVVTGKINLKSKTTANVASKTILTPTLTPTPTQKNNNGGFFGFLKGLAPKSKSTPTPTPTQSPISIATSTNTTNTSNTGINNIYNQNNQPVNVSRAKSIPSTGLPTLFLPLLFSGLVGGSILRKTGKK